MEEVAGDAAGQLHDPAGDRPPDPGTASDRPSDAALWASVSRTLRDVVLPSLADEWARSMTIQLVGLAEQALVRGDDPMTRRRGELSTAVDSIATNPLVSEHWPGDPHVAAAAALRAAVGRDDPAADEVRAVLRPVLVAQLDDELSLSSPLIEAFRGRLPR